MTLLRVLLFFFFLFYGKLIEEEEEDDRLCARAEGAGGMREGRGGIGHQGHPQI